MAMSMGRVLLVGSVLYLCYSLGDASLARVTSLTTSVVEQTLSAHVRGKVAAGKQARYKRELVTKTLDDPKSCLNQCQDNETSALTKAVLRNTARLVALALEDLTGDETKTPEKKAAFEKSVEQKTIANMGPLFEDLCRIHKSSGLCYSNCPDSQAKTLMGFDNEGSQITLCEPSRNWNNFSEYWGAVNCTNATEADKPCVSKCGPDLSINNETKLEFPAGSADDDLGLGGSLGGEEENDDEKPAATSFNIKYETDSKTNTATANRVCKTITCELDCYKPIMTKQCGAKAYEMYSRMQKVDPKYSVSILKTMKAIDQADDCKPYA